MLYRISYLWYSAIGFLVTILIGLGVSFLTGPTDPQNVDEDLLSPPFKRLYSSLPARTKTVLNLQLVNYNTKNDSNSDLKGVDNVTLDIADEMTITEKPQNKIETNGTKAKRKISAP